MKGKEKESQNFSLQYSCKEKDFRAMACHTEDYGWKRRTRKQRLPEAKHKINLQHTHAY